MTAQDLIANAIGSKEVITFRYDGTGRRVEPHIIGYDQKGHLVLSAWQLSGTGQGWSLFHVSTASELATTGETFLRARSDYNRNDDNFSRILARL